MTENDQIRPGNDPQGPSAETPEINNSVGVDPIAPAANTPVAAIPVTINEASEKFYGRIVRRLIRRSTAQRSIDPLEPVMVSPTMLVDDLFSRTDLEPASFSTYRSALLWHLMNRRDDPNHAVAIERLNERSKPTASETAQKTKPRRRKVIPESDLHILVEELTSLSSRSKWAYRTIYFLMSGLATGLRPVEWSSAAWVDEERTALVLDNAKIKLAAPAFLRKGPKAVTQGQGSDDLDDEGMDDDPEVEAHEGQSDAEYVSKVPPTRQVPVPNRQDRFFVEKHMELVAEQMAAGVTLQHYYEQCRRALWRSCRKLWGSKKTYSLYTMRGQYSANQRAAVGSAKTSVLMGHSRPDSPSASHYGKANQAHAGFAERRGQDDQQQIEAPTEAQAPVMGLPQE